MSNLMKKMSRLTLIESWYDARVGTASQLALLFGNAIGEQNVFSAIYVAIRNNPQNASQEASETYTYYNVGFSDAEIAAYFNLRYGANYFCYSYRDSLDIAALRDKLTSIYKANKYKYMKLVEILGYKYNPLYNVDGKELYSNMESIGDTKTTRTPDGTITSTSGTMNNNTIGASTTTNYTNPYDQNTSSSAADYVDSKTQQDAVTTQQTYEEYSETTELENEPATGYILNPQTGKYEKSGLFSVAAADSAFNVALSGAERYYAEKRIRQGNIGVTKSTELIAAQRDIVKYNILDEFMRDIEHDLVVGIYD